MGGVNNTDHYASEAFLPMSFPAKSFQKEHVPFVGSTEVARLLRSGLDRCRADATIWNYRVAIATCDH